MTNTFAPQNGIKWNVDRLNEAFASGTYTVSGTGVSVVEKAKGFVELTFPISALSVTMTDATTAGSHGRQKILTFPQGLILVAGAVTDLTIARVGTNITTTASVVAALGTTGTATADATLTTTEANIIASTAATLTAGAGVFKGVSADTVTLNGTTTPAEVFLNFAIPDAGSAGNDALLVNGNIKLTFMLVGDN